MADHAPRFPLDPSGDDDAVWQDLVARLQETDDGGIPPGAPAHPGAPGAVPAPGRDRPVRAFRDFDPLGVWIKSAPPVPAPGPRDYDVDDTDEEFVPAEPPSLANAEPALVLAWIGAAGGPVFLFLAALFWRGIPFTALVVVLMAFIGCSGYLIYRLPKQHDHDGDDGAVV